ncbi:MAG: sugar phosphate isomerase/epimerase [Firmicutes bacterium]|nr:sugar phosphate isomerase/epimerase [Bacillota bacterium]
MKKGINRWSLPADWSIRQCMERAKEAGFEGIELALDETGELSLESDEQQVKAVRKMAADIGLELKSLATGLFWKYSLTANDPDVREKARSVVVKALDVAQWLGADTVLVVPGVVSAPFATSERTSYADAWDRAIEALQELALEAEQRQVSIGIENVWNKFLLSPVEMREFIDTIDSQYVGAYFDVGNVLLYGFPEDWIRVLGPRIKKVHFKDFRTAVGTLAGFVNLLEGDVNWPEVMAAFDEIGYTDYAYTELSPYRYHSDALIDDISRAMDRILGIE